MRTVWHGDKGRSIDTVQLNVVKRVERPNRAGSIRDAAEMPQGVIVAGGVWRLRVSKDALAPFHARHGGCLG